MYNTNSVGRAEIWTDVPEITSKNIIPILRQAIATHTANAMRIDYLLRYDEGEQPLQRVKTYRADINCECIDNVANEVTEFNLGFKWGNAITLVQRGESDSGTKDEPQAITLLNECYSAENIDSKHQRLGRFVEVGGVGYTYVDVKRDWMPGDSYFQIESLDPRYTFVVRSSYYIDHRVMIGVTFRVDDMGLRHATAFTSDRRYELSEFEVMNGKKKDTDWGETVRSGERNPLGVIPIIEWVRSYDRMGCFERCLSECDNLNLLISDFSNDVDQNTQCIWHGNDIMFPVDDKGNSIRPTSGDWLLTQTTQDGKQPFVKPLAAQYDYTGMLNNIISRRSLILQKCNVPQRNDNSGGSTGIAMSDATGWSAAESAACKQQNLMVSSKMEEVKAVLRAIRISPNVPSDSPLLDLRYMDVQPNIKRQKTYEMVTKANAFAVLVQNGIYGLHALKAINLFDDVNQVWDDSKDAIVAYQAKLITGGETGKDKAAADETDQISNSPNVDGMDRGGTED